MGVRRYEHLTAEEHDQLDVDVHLELVRLVAMNRASWSPGIEQLDQEGRVQDQRHSPPNQAAQFSVTTPLI